MTNGTQWRSWLINDHWFNDLPTLLQDSLLVGMRQRRVTPGKLIFQHNAPPCGLYALLEGSVRFNDLKQQRQGLPATVSKRPYWFGEVSLFDDQPCRHDAYAEGQVILLHMPHASLSQLLQERAPLWRYFGQLLGRKLGVAIPPIEQIILLPTTERVAFRLLMLCEGFGELNRSLRRVSLTHMASDRCLGLSGEVVERVLGEFAERNIVRREQDCIEVLDVDRLRSAAHHRLTQISA